MANGVEKGQGRNEDERIVKIGEATKRRKEGGKKKSLNERAHDIRVTRRG